MHTIGICTLYVMGKHNIIPISYHVEKDKELIEWLKSKSNISGYVKYVLYEKMYEEKKLNLVQNPLNDVVISEYVRNIINNQSREVLDNNLMQNNTNINTVIEQNDLTENIEQNDNIDNENGIDMEDFMNMLNNLDL